MNMAGFNTLWLVFCVGLCSLVIITNSEAEGGGGSSRRECNFPAIFNFGDSNSDTGGLSAAFGQAGPPAGESFFHHPAGRYSDGRLVIDFIGTLILHFLLFLITFLFLSFYCEKTQQNKT